MGVETTISLSLIFSSISMIGVLANIYISFKRESESSKLKEVQIEKHFAQIDVKLENFFSTMTEIVRKNETCTQKIDENLKAILQSNERIGTLFRLHDDNVRRIESLEERANKNDK